MRQSCSEDLSPIVSKSGWGIEESSCGVNMRSTEKKADEFPDLTVPEMRPRELVFTKLGLSPVVSVSPPRELTLFPPSSPFHSKKSRAEEPVLKANTDRNTGSSRKNKGCHCRQSKCLKLYCECFASGVFCSGCDCADCLNNLENLDMRQTAVENILYRNPNAFKGKLPQSPSDNQDQTIYVTEAGMRPRGCKCKRTECLKKYCECYQTNVFCSENCKCINCKNVREEVQTTIFACEQNSSKPCAIMGKPERTSDHSWDNTDSKNLEESEDRAIFSWGYNCGNSAQGIIFPNRYDDFINWQAAGCMNNAFEFSAYSSSQVCRMRKFQELLNAGEIHRTEGHEQVNSHLALFTAMPMDAVRNSPSPFASGALKIPCRKRKPPLPDFTLLPDMVDVCSLLLSASETAKRSAGKTTVIELQPNLDNETRDFQGGGRFCKCSIEPDVKQDIYFEIFGPSPNDEVAQDFVNESENGREQERTPPSGRMIELIDAQYKEHNPKDLTANCGYEADIYLEQERAVLETLRDCLKKLIMFGCVGGKFQWARSSCLTSRTEP